MIGGLFARGFGFSAPFWFAVFVVLVVLVPLPFVNNGTVDEAKKAA